MGTREGRRNLTDWLARPMGPTRNVVKIQKYIKIEFRKILVAIGTQCTNPHPF